MRSGCIIDAIYLLVLVSLCMLWSASHSILWWLILSSAIVMFLTSRAVVNIDRRAKEKIAKRLGRSAIELRYMNVPLSEYGSWLGPAKLWIAVNAVTTIVTLILAIVGVFIGCSALF